MSTATTRSTTFTAVDIRRVVDNFAADFSMIGQSTGLRSRESVANTVADLKKFAEYGFLTEVALVLKDKVGEQLRGAVYKVSESALGWQSDRPGNNLWPRTPDGRLKVVATLNSGWWDKSDAARQQFIDNQGMHNSWSPTDEDLSFLGLTPSEGQRYASNGYGMQRTNFS